MRALELFPQRFLIVNSGPHCRDQTCTAKQHLQAVSHQAEQATSSVPPSGASCAKLRSICLLTPAPLRPRRTPLPGVTRTDAAHHVSPQRLRFWLRGSSPPSARSLPLVVSLPCRVAMRCGVAWRFAFHSFRLALPCGDALYLRWYSFCLALPCGVM